MISSEDRRRELSRRLEKVCKKPVGKADDDAILSLAEEIDALIEQQRLRPRRRALVRLKYRRDSGKTTGEV